MNKSKSSYVREKKNKRRTEISVSTYIAEINATEK